MKRKKISWQVIVEIILIVLLAAGMFLPVLNINGENYVKTAVKVNEYASDKEIKNDSGEKEAKKVTKKNKKENKTQNKKKANDKASVKENKSSVKKEKAETKKNKDDKDADNDAKKAKNVKKKNNNESKSNSKSNNEEKTGDNASDKENSDDNGIKEAKKVTKKYKDGNKAWDKKVDELNDQDDFKTGSVSRFKFAKWCVTLRSGLDFDFITPVKGKKLKDNTAKNLFRFLGAAVYLSYLVMLAFLIVVIIKRDTFGGFFIISGMIPAAVDIYFMFFMSDGIWKGIKKYVGSFDMVSADTLSLDGVGKHAMKYMVENFSGWGIIYDLVVSCLVVIFGILVISVLRPAVSYDEGDEDWSDIDNTPASDPGWISFPEYGGNESFESRYNPASPDMKTVAVENENGSGYADIFAPGGNFTSPGNENADKRKQPSFENYGPGSEMSFTEAKDPVLDTERSSPDEGYRGDAASDHAAGGAGDSGRIPVPAKGSSKAQQAGSGTVLTLVGVRGQYTGQTIEFGGGELLVLGRDPRKCNIIFSSKNVSRVHAGIIFDEERNMYKVINYSSTGTTMVYYAGKINGEMKFTRRREIHSKRYKYVERGTYLYIAGDTEGFLLG